MKLETLTLEHLAALDLQEKQDKTFFTGACAEALVAQPFAFALLDKGRVVATGGVVELHDGVARGWLGLSRDIRCGMSTLYRWIWRSLGALYDSGYHRIEAHVDQDYTAGHRLMRLLGFQFEGVLRQYGPNRRNYVLYAWVRNDG